MINDVYRNGELSHFFEEAFSKFNYQRSGNLNICFLKCVTVFEVSEVLLFVTLLFFHFDSIS